MLSTVLTNKIVVKLGYINACLLSGGLSLFSLYLEYCRLQDKYQKLSRDYKEEEKADGLNATVLAYDGIAIIVNSENPVSDLDVETIAKIYTGGITNWSEVGGNDAEIVLVGREAGSGTRDGFESITDSEDACK